MNHTKTHAKLTYADHIANAGDYYERAMRALGDGPDTSDYVRAKVMMELASIALDLAREARLYDAAMFAQEKALDAERANAERAARRAKTKEKQA